MPKVNLFHFISFHLLSNCIRKVNFVFGWLVGWCVSFRFLAFSNHQKKTINIQSWWWFAGNVDDTKRERERERKLSSSYISSFDLILSISLTFDLMAISTVVVVVVVVHVQHWSLSSLLTTTTATLSKIHDDDCLIIADL